MTRVWFLVIAMVLASAACAPWSAGYSPTDDPGAVRHFATDRIGFDYPATWIARSETASHHRWTHQGFVGTAPSVAYCTTTSMGTSTSIQCGAELQLEPGDISIEVVVQGSPAMPDPFVPTADLPPGAARWPIDGAPATLLDQAGSAMGADRMLMLAVPDRAGSPSVTMLRAWLRGPHVETLAAQARGVFATVHYEPPLRPTAGESEQQALAIAGFAVDAMALRDPDYACFPRRPELINQALIRSFPDHGPLLKELPVRCSMAIEGTALELWRLSLTIEWDAAADRNAGRATIVSYLDLGGETTGFGTGFDTTLPYMPTVSGAPPDAAPPWIHPGSAQAEK